MVLFILTVDLMTLFVRGSLLTLRELGRDFLFMFSFHAVSEGEMAGAIFFFSALFVSAWSWLYALTALITRLVVRVFPATLQSTTWFFDINGHPLRSLGCIAGGIVFIGVLAARVVAYSV
jgi:hypothetical protein